MKNKIIEDGEELRNHIINDGFQPPYIDSILYNEWRKRCLHFVEKNIPSSDLKGKFIEAVQRTEYTHNYELALKYLKDLIDMEIHKNDGRKTNLDPFNIKGKKLNPFNKNK